jgi:hypothetical protein
VLVDQVNEFKDGPIYPLIQEYLKQRIEMIQSDLESLFVINCDQFGREVSKTVVTHEEDIINKARIIELKGLLDLPSLLIELAEEKESNNTSKDEEED